LVEYKPTKPMTLSWFSRRINHIGNEKGPDFNEGSSEEYWTMGESSIQQHHQGEEGENCKALMPRKIMTIFGESALANFVPAAAVKREGRVLFVWTWRKGYVGGL
jgi:hypothetical protein